jgi:hypothetical protein
MTMRDGAIVDQTRLGHEPSTLDSLVTLTGPEEQP